MKWCFEVTIQIRGRIIIIIIIDQLLLWLIMKEEKISEACSMYCGNEKRIQRFVKEKKEKEYLEDLVFDGMIIIILMLNV
jgi:hypothetical protein